MTSMPASAPASQQSSEHERIPLRHGLTAVVIRYRDDEPRPERPKHLISRAARQQAEVDAWMAEQGRRETIYMDTVSPKGDGAA